MSLPTQSSLQGEFLHWFVELQTHAVHWEFKSFGDQHPLDEWFFQMLVYDFHQAITDLILSGDFQPLSVDLSESLRSGFSDLHPHHVKTFFASSHLRWVNHGIKFQVVNLGEIIHRLNPVTAHFHNCALQVAESGDTTSHMFNHRRVNDDHQDDEADATVATK